MRHNRHHIAIIIVFVVIAAFLVAATHYGTKTLSALRAYTAAESQWTKNQKEMSNLLLQYVINQDSNLYRSYGKNSERQHQLRSARKMILAENTPKDRAFEVLTAGNINPQDASLIIWFTTNFKGFDFMNRGMEAWRRADQKITEMDSLANRLHAEVSAGNLTEEGRSKYVRQINQLDQQLTFLESQFAAVMGKASNLIREGVLWTIILAGGLLMLGGYMVVSNLFSKIEKLNAKLYESETKFKQVLKYTKDVIYQLNVKTGDYEYISPHIRQMLGYSPKTLKENGVEFIRNKTHPDDLERLKETTEIIEEGEVKGGFSEVMEMRVKRKNGEYIWIRNHRTLIRDSNGAPSAVVGCVRDVTEWKKRQTNTEQSLKQKKTLLEEIHHRIKNNLAIISSIIELQKQDTEDEKGILADIQSRLRSVAKIHEKLYQTDGFSSVDMKDYIDDFSKVVMSTYDISRQVKVDNNLESFRLDVDRAISVGLIYNELFNNVFKHALSENGEGEIRVELSTENSTAVLSVADNGKGLPGDFNIEDCSSLGMTLVKKLTRQLEGDLRITQNGWTKFEVTFPITGEG